MVKLFVVEPLSSYVEVAYGKQGTVFALSRYDNEIFLTFDSFQF